jgi:hypothetical protein
MTAAIGLARVAHCRRCVRVVTGRYLRAPSRALRHMNSPHVIELPRRLEPVTRDTFLGGTEARLAKVIAFRPRKRLAAPKPRPVAPAPPAAA